MITHYEVIFRLIVAALLGAAVGLERERLERVAGLRTHMLVSLASALIITISAYGFNEVISPGRVVLDPSRVAAQIVSGIGFLGAGTILFLRHQVIRGLTTAASLWAVAAVGMAAGCGLYVAAVSTTVLIVVILALVKPLEMRLFHREHARRLALRMNRNLVSLAKIEEELNASGLTVRKITMQRGKADDEDQVEFDFLEGMGKEASLALVDRLRKLEGVRGVSL